MSMTNLIGSILSEIQRANDAVEGNAATIHDAISALIEAGGESGDNIVKGTVNVSGGATKSIAHNTGWDKYILIATLTGDPTTNTDEYRSVYCMAYVDLAGAGVPDNSANNTFFCAQRYNAVKGTYSTTCNTSNASTSNSCTCTANAMIGGSWKWFCVKAG